MVESDAVSMKKVLILGGYGNFGKRIAENLCQLPDTQLIIAGRDVGKAHKLTAGLQSRAATPPVPLAIDINAADFESQLQALTPDIVIHTGGPFQGQDHRVPKACIAAGAHYIDLADDRRFVCDIKSLDDAAKANQVLLVSGASSVPGLSSTVIDHYHSLFTSINSIDVAIAPGNRAERGEATVRGILSYTGHPYPVFSGGNWCEAYGWMGPRLADFGDRLGKRWMANVDVPDLELFPSRYAVKERVQFQAGLELSLLHLIMVGMAHTVKIGLVKNWAPLTKLILKTSELFNRLGSDDGGMQVQLEGCDQQGKPITIKWSLFAPDGVGPYIPTLSAVIIAKKLLSGELTEIGATPCVGLYELADFLPYAEQLGIYFKEQING